MKYEEGEYQSGSGSWLLSFFIGGLVGAGVALLMAPRSGRQTRRQIKDVATDAKDKATDYYDEMRGKISTAMQKGADLLHEKKSEAQSAAKEMYERGGGGTP